MSYSAELRQTLCRLPVPPEARRFVCFGLTYFSRRFSEEWVGISVSNEAAADLCRELLPLYSGSGWDESRSGAGTARFGLTGTAAKRFFYSFGADPGGDAPDMLRVLTSDPEAAGYFLRGAFLLYGNMSDPRREYHIEFDLYGESRVRAVKSVLAALDLHPKTVVRGRLTVVYICSAEGVSDLLGYMGDGNAMMEAVQLKALGDVRSLVNKRVNFDRANLKRSSMTSARQIAAVESLRDSGRLDSLPPELRELAVLRAENPGMSLEALGAALKKPVTRSCVARRLKKIEDLAQNTG